ncbi:uncharacterized protein TM35_000151030, partial [Trypanosoma theileri]
MMMRRVMCVLAVVLCCACGYTMTAAAADSNVASLAPTFRDWGATGTLTSPSVITGQPTGTRRITDELTHSHGSELEKNGLSGGRTEVNAEVLPPEGDPAAQVPGKEGGLSKPHVSSDHSRGSEAGHVERGTSAVQGEESSAVQSEVSTLPS